MSNNIFRHRSGSSLLCLVGVGLLLGSLDLLFASTYWYLLHGVTPASILQGIASGLLGARAFAGGAATVWLGALLHYAVMQTMVFAFVAASRRAPALLCRPWLYGTLYGLLLYAVMNGFVQPLSAAASAPMLPSWIVSSIVVHAWLIGVPIALAARWTARRDGMHGGLDRSATASMQAHLFSTDADAPIANKTAQ